MNKIQFLIIHHTGVSYKEIPDQFDSVNQFHKEKWGMKSKLGYFGGYNYIMSADGVIKQYREDGEETVAVVGHNTDSLHICLSGNFNLEQPTTTQRHNLREWIKVKMKQYNVPIDKIKSHRYFKNTTDCCGKNLSDNELYEMATPQDSEEIVKIGHLERLLGQLRELYQLLKELLNKGQK